jgi:2-dehydropantoate 2-reductase
MRFHVLGLGPIGSLVAHHLRLVLPREHPITLVHRSKRLVTLQRRDGGEILTEVDGNFATSTGYDSEVFDQEELVRKGIKSRQEFQGRTLNIPEKPVESVDPLKAIESLIITTKAQSTLPAITRLLPRLSSNSTIVLLQNGLGVYEELIQEIFRNPENRPQFILASNNHGAWLKNYGHVVHAGVGEIEFGIIPDPQCRDFEASWKDESVPIYERRLHIDDIGQRDEPDFPRYRSLRLTVAALSAMEALNTKWKPIEDVLVAMRRKLAVNAVINPLTALMGCRNGDVFTQRSSLRIARRICSEASTAYACELTSLRHSMLASSGDEDNEAQIPVGRLPRALEQNSLEQECLRVADKTKGNISSMLTDIRQGRPTEIEYINGYLLKLGVAHGVQMPGNAMLLHLIKMRSAIPLDQML